MAIPFLLSTAFLAMLSPLPASLQSADHTDVCLPPGIESTTVVSIQAAKPGRRAKIATVTVAQKLKELRARCRKGKLVDANGTEIRFYHLVGCWGNPPDNYQEQLDRQTKELESLRKRYQVIELTCESSLDDRLRVTPPPTIF
jgi:hypothetical protein